MTDKERLAQWTKNALAHKDGMGRPIEQPVAQELQGLPKDATGQVIIPDNVSEKRLTVVKSVMTPKRMVGVFANSPVVNALTDF